MELPPLPKTFDRVPYLNQWFHWSRVEKCFWPGRGQRRDKVDAELSPICGRGGIYIFRWSDKPAPNVRHTDPAVIYIGETSGFRGRMGKWALSAGFWGKRQKGHYAAFRWSEGREHLWVAFYDLLPLASRRLAKHARLYFEVVATEEYRVAHGKLPRVNEWEAVAEA